MIPQLSRLFGFDVFISYAYADGREYAKNLHQQLTDLDLVCFLDEEELPYGEKLKPSLERAIRRSEAFVLVGTEGATKAHHVAHEVKAALHRRKVFIPVDVHGVRSHHQRLDLESLPWIVEPDRSARKPSAVVLEGIRRHFRFTRRNRMTRRIVGLAALIFLLVALAALWQWREATAQQHEAVQQARLADEQRKKAEAAAGEAMTQRSVAEEQTNVAEKQR